MGRLCQSFALRLSFGKELYLWGWRWVVFVVFGLPYGLGGIYDFLLGQEFISNSYPTLGSIIPAWLPSTWLILGVIAIIIVTFEGAYRITKRRILSESEVTDTIRLLQAEKLELKNNNGEERSYSFAQVFRAIADQLSIGISSIYFEETVKKELAMNANEGWYLPYEDKGIIHLIGALYQNTLIDRFNEEHQRIVPDYSQGDFSQGITVFTKPKWLTEKGIEAIYYLSPFGRRVIQQLRKQLTSHKEGSQTE